MATYEYTLPELGEGIESGEVVHVLVAEGDTITKDQPVLELETDKAVIEVPAPVGGVVKMIHVREGDKAAVGQLLLTVEADAVDTTPVVPAPAAKAAAPEAAVSLVVPREATPAPQTTEPARGVKHEAGAAAPPARGDVVELAAPPTVDQQPGRQGPVAPAAPSVRRLAREIGVDINAVPGSGPGGRISVEDVKRYAHRLLADSGDVRAAPQPVVPALPDFARWGEVERQPMSGVRRKTAQHMAQAWATIPHVTQFAKADITELEQLRQRFAPKAEAAGGKLTITAIVLKVVAAALKHFPQFNASLDTAHEEVVYKKYYHLGVAVATERGLLVPVIRDVDRKSLLALSVELTQVAERARSRKTTLEEMQGGTFTVTNLGGIGGTYFSPLINAPEVAILGLARSSMEPVYTNGQFEPRLMLPLALSYDHRLIDGADGARFVRWIAETLQEPFLIALEG